jgi:hypothetical protein
LGAAIASIGGLSLKANFPDITVKMYTFGGFVLGGFETSTESIASRPT